MTVKKYITCTEAGKKYDVLLIAKDKAVFTAAEQAGLTVGKEGEELVEAYKNAVKGGILSVQRKTPAHRLNNSPKGKPAVEGYGDDGRLVLKQYYTRGVRTNAMWVLKDGTTLTERYNRSGELDNGQPDNGLRGAALRVFSPKGRLVCEESYTQGLLNNSPAGAAVKLYREADGAVQYEANYVLGKRKKPTAAH